MTLTLALLALFAQAVPPGKAGDPHPDVPQQRVDEAIKKGTLYLQGLPRPSPGKMSDRDYELVLLALIHGGVAEEGPLLDLLKEVTGRKLEGTYQVSLLAMSLEELNRKRYDSKRHLLLYQCAQFLVDNQNEGGRWSYGEPSEFADRIPTPAGTPPRATTPTGPKSFDEKPVPRLRLPPVKKMKTPARAGGDQSNSQYAALGLRACFEAGIELPQEVVVKARQAWIDAQHPADGPKGAKPGVSTGPAPARGWCYQKGAGSCQLGGAPYGSMTAGAVSALCLYDFMLGRDWKKDPAIQSGVAWMAANWTVTENPGPLETGGPQKNEKTWLSYYLYAIERVGMLFDSPRIGPHDWYKDGALFLLDRQSAEGSWRNLSNDMSPASDTAYAILFLKRATRPMVASSDRFFKK
jgi:hypothetical protein